MLYVEDSHTEVIDGSPSGHAAYVALDTELRAVLKIRKSVNNQQISQLQQGTRSLEEYLLHAQKLVSEVRDIEVSAHMEQQCSQLIYGLRSDIKRSIEDSMLALIEENIDQTTTSAKVQVVQSHYAKNSHEMRHAVPFHIQMHRR
jgi:hypothetical protein